jgi:hypothetical protein
MRFPCISVFLALLVPAAVGQAQTPLPSGTTHYTIYQGDKSVGSSDATIAPAPSGYTITSHGELHLSKFSYSFNNTQNLDHMLNLVSDQITGTVNGSPVTFTINSDSTGRQFNIKVNAKGKETQNTIDRHQHLAVLADLDAAGYILLTRIGLANPAVSWALIPKENGLLVPTVYQEQSGVQGTLNGSPVDAEHMTVTVSAQNSITVELFHTPEGRLLEADLPEQNFFVVLNGFKLTNRPKFAPPHSPEENAPPPQQNGAPYPNQQNGPPQYPNPQGAPPPQTQQQ